MGKPPRSHKRSSIFHIDPDLSLTSVQHALKPSGSAWERSLRVHAAPNPAGIPRRKSRQLKALRAAEIWKTGAKDAQVKQMALWFPDIPKPRVVPDSDDMEVDTPEPTKDIKMANLTISQRPPPLISPDSECPDSDIGIFGKLPGELRNRIYRLAFVKNTPTEVSMEPRTCAVGACLHSKLALQVPGIANTCRQLRWEVMPIFCAENVSFEFDDAVVQQGCVVNYLQNLGDYADLIPQFEFLLKRPLWNQDTFVKFATYRFILTPSLRTDGEPEWKLTYTEDDNRKICDCVVHNLVDEMNAEGAEKSVGKAVIKFVDSEEWADFIWRVRKTKQWHNQLARCKKCREVLFNN